MPNIQVVGLHGFRTTVQVSPSTVMQEVLVKACSAARVDTGRHCLTFQGKAIDPSRVFRMCYLPNGAKLNLEERKRPPTSGGLVMIGVQTPEGRVTAKLPCTTSLYALVEFFVREKGLDVRSCGLAPDGGSPVLVYMGRELPKEADEMKASTITTALGLTSGSALLRLELRASETPSSAPWVLSETAEESPEVIPAGSASEVILAGSASEVSSEVVQSGSASGPLPSVSDTHTSAEASRESLAGARAGLSGNFGTRVTGLAATAEDAGDDCIVVATEAEAVPKDGGEVDRIDLTLSDTDPGSDTAGPRHTSLTAAACTGDISGGDGVGGGAAKGACESGVIDSDGGKGGECDFVGGAGGVASSALLAMDVTDEHIQGAQNPPPKDGVSVADVTMTDNVPPSLHPGETAMSDVEIYEASRKAAEQAARQRLLMNKSSGPQPDPARSSKKKRPSASPSLASRLPRGVNERRAPPKNVSLENRPPLEDRCVRFLTPPTLSEASVMSDLPDSVYDFTKADLERLMSCRKPTEEPILRTKDMRDKETRKKMLQYEKTTLRILFPSRVMLQADFRPEEPLSAVMDVVRSYLASSATVFHLYITPPLQRLDSSCTETLYSLGLYPCALLRFGLGTPKAPIYTERRDVEFLDQKYLENVAPVPVDPSITEAAKSKHQELKTSDVLGIGASELDLDVPMEAGSGGCVSSLGTSEKRRHIDERPESSGDTSKPKVPKWFKKF